MHKNTAFIVTAAFFIGLMTGCQPKTTTEKVKDKVKEATRETGQAIENVGKDVKDTAK